jgi:hypothetical protein
MYVIAVLDKNPNENNLHYYPRESLIDYGFDCQAVLIALALFGLLGPRPSIRIN